MTNETTLTILGCGTSSGVPLVGCHCEVCRSSNEKDKRTRASVLFQVNGLNVLVDTSTDLRFQALRENLQRVDAVLYTHPHADHISGIDDLRAFNFIQKAPIPLWGNAWVVKDLTDRYSYVFSQEGKGEGGGIPRLTMNPVNPKDPVLHVLGVPVVPLPVEHGSKECLGYRINSVAYLTDCSYIPPETLARMENLQVLVLDCVRIKPHGTHFHLDQALKIISQLAPKQAYLTHLGHDFGYDTWNKKLPKGVELAYDGLKVTVS